MLRVFETIWYGVTEEEVISDDLVEFVEKQMRKGERFNIKSVPPGINPAEIPHAIIAYNQHYGGFISDPGLSIRGCIGVDPDHGRLVYNPQDPAFFDQRDAIHFTTPQDRYVRAEFSEVLAAFAEEGYGLFKFFPRRPGDSLLRQYREGGFQVGERIDLERFLNME